MHSSLPTARLDDLVVQETGSEVLIFDKRNDQASVLNRTAAVIWNLADGSKTVDEIARAASLRLNASINTSLVWYTLEQLSRKNLMQRPVVAPAPLRGLTRRELLRAGAIGAAVVLPVIVTLAAPAVSHAASCVDSGQPCTTPSECCSGLCNTNTCA